MSVFDDLLAHLSECEIDALATADELGEQRILAIAKGRRARGETPGMYVAESVSATVGSSRHIRNWDAHLPAARKSNAGRPKHSWDVFLETYALEVHERLRQQGRGRNAVIIETVAECRKRFPNACISSTRVKEIVAKLQPEVGFLFPVGDMDNLQHGVFRVTKEGDKWLLSFGPRPEFGKRGIRRNPSSRKKPIK